jgi:hypothetical protein
MSKGKPISNEYTTIDTLCTSIVSLLLNEEKVVIPELGYLELKVFPDKRTVLFKATENLPLFLSSEGSIQSHIYNSVSVPLKEGKVVNLPEVGIFRPIRNANGSGRISYTISSSLRKLLNDEKENETNQPEISETSVKVDNEIVPAPIVDEHEVLDESAGKEETKEAAENKTEYKAVENNKKIREKVVPAPRESRGERKMPSYVRNPSKVGDLVVSQEKTESNAAKMKGIIAIVAALIVLILLVWYFLPQGNKYRDESTFVGNETESTQEINESIKSYKSIDLPSIAERKYGNRIFWVYIYEANRDKISSPVNIPAGTDLRIPNLWEDYKVDVMDSMEIKRAGILSDIMLKQKIQL